MADGLNIDHGEYHRFLKGLQGRNNWCMNCSAPRQLPNELAKQFAQQLGVTESISWPLRLFWELNTLHFGQATGPLSRNKADIRRVSPYKFYYKSDLDFGMAELPSTGRLSAPRALRWVDAFAGTEKKMG